MIKISRAYLLFALLSATPSAFADQILASFDYGDLRANENYTTNAVLAFGAPLEVKAVQIKVFGEFCQIISRELIYNRFNGGPAIAARPDGAGGFLVNDTIFAMEYRFKQTKWTRVDCRLEIWASGDSHSEENLQSDALSLSINSKLLNLAIGQNAEYAALQTKAQNLRDYADYFADAAKSGQSTERLSGIFKLVKNANQDFEEAFLPVHIRIRDRNIEDAWQLYVASFDRIEF